MSNNKGSKLSTIIILGGIVLSMIVIFLGVKTDNQVVSLAGAGLFFLTVAIGVFMGDSSKKGSGSGKVTGAAKMTARKYEPLLIDERTKQDPEVQRLLQYTSVQRVFFDPDFLKTAEAQSDPNVRELMAVLDNIMSTQTENGVYPPYPNQAGFNGTNAYAD